MSAIANSLNRRISQAHVATDRFFESGRTASHAGDIYLQIGTILLFVPAGVFLLSVFLLTLGGTLGTFASIALLLLTFIFSLIVASAYGRKTLIGAAAICLAVYVASLALCDRIVDLSYDGQDYHFTAIWALSHGWNPFHFGKFEHFVAPASKKEPWAPHYPKGDWLFSAVEVSAGLSSEAAKNNGILLFVSALATVFGVARRLKAGTFVAAILAIIAACDPVTVSQLFMRMCDGRLASLSLIFLAFSLLALQTNDRRYFLQSLIAMVLAVNTKFSMVPMFALFGLCICGGIALRDGWRRGAVFSGGFLALAFVGVFVAGWDPYLRNTVMHGHPFFPVMGKGRIDTMWDWRPATLAPHSDLVRLWLSLISKTGYSGPDLKFPLSITSDEFNIAGDPEPRFAGFGPFFFAGLMASIAGLLSQIRAVPRRWDLQASLLLLSAAVLLSTLLMPESWLARYVPQFWLVPVFLAAAGLASPNRLAHIFGWLCIGLLGLDSAVVTASSFQIEAAQNTAIRAQLERLLGTEGHLCANFEGSPARLAFFNDKGLQVRILRSPPPKTCANVEDMPSVYGDNEKLGYICKCQH